MLELAGFGKFVSCLAGVIACYEHVQICMNRFYDILADVLYGAG